MERQDIDIGIEIKRLTEVDRQREPREGQREQCKNSTDRKEDKVVRSRIPMCISITWRFKSK